MSSSPAIREAAKQIVKCLERFPEDRFKHLTSFKDIQMNRFRRIAGLAFKGEEEGGNKPNLSDVKDMITRTSGPLGLQKDFLKKLQGALQNDTATEQDISRQRHSLEALMSNKYKNYYDVGDKLYRPNGNPQYYQRLMDEITGQKKENLLTGLRTVFFGK
ncbi:Cytochrome B pre-mRNA-processing protein 6 [Nakaseomyces bracarensis]|uniref:Cytochrome B pre-mRNA-processing protein 6 n=1 Tax=Nakaseomyces bracarensis TaxID=273131 RepID=A0ABR4NRM4_9SACH